MPEYQPHEDAIGGTPTQPHLYLHGETDGCMGVEIAHMAAPLMTTAGSFVEIVDGAGHFLQLEQPELVNRAIIDFVT